MPSGSDTKGAPCRPFDPDCAADLSQAGDDAPVLRLELQKARERRPHRELRRIAAVDPSQKRLRQVVDGLLPEAPPDERGYRLVGRRRGGWPQRFGRHSQLAEPREGVGGNKRHPLRRYAEHRGFRQLPQAPRPDDKRVPTELRTEARPESELATEIDRGCLLSEEGVRASVDRVSAHPLGLHDATQPIASFQEHEGDAGGLQLIRGGESADAAADNGDRGVHSPNNLTSACAAGSDDSAASTRSGTRTRA